ncbi:MAG: hypothetical protein KatS3mg013_1713 [Actinomycetota bacterium]|nr:MAG: hypothetical protein KatS3mg013_1713 [Actinomycetota bacterium]
MAPRRSLARPPAVARVLQRIVETARTHDQFRAGETVLVSVSGGPDSMCLLESLVRLRRLFKIRLTVLHVDHGLRRGAGKEAAYVRRACRRLGVPFHGWVAEGGPGRGASVEAWAAAERRRAAAAVGRRVGADVLAEGHTLDDQAETVLLNLIRGSGLEGLAGIAPRLGERPGTITVQPLLAVRRDEVEAFCRSLGLRPRRDPMNEDRRLLRAAIRHELLPAIERAVGRDVRAPIARTADHLLADREALDRAGAEAYRRVAREVAGGVVLDAGALAALDPAIASRVVRLAAYRSLPPDAPSPWAHEAIAAVLDLARGRPGRRRDLPGGLRAVRDRGAVVIGTAPAVGHR